MRVSERRKLNSLLRLQIKITANEPNRKINLNKTKQLKRKVK